MSTSPSSSSSGTPVSSVFTRRKGYWREAALLNGDTGRYDGINVLLLDGKTILLAAVLNSKGDPNASRVYHAPRYCAAA